MSFDNAGSVGSLTEPHRLKSVLLVLQISQTSCLECSRVSLRPI